MNEYNNNNNNNNNNCGGTNVQKFENENYSFCLFRIPEVGKRAIWQISNVCNYNCSYCIFASGSKRIEGELNTDQALKTVDQLYDLGYTHLKITGGEPFIRKDLGDIIKRAKSYGMNVDVSTNASLITKEKALNMAKAGLDMMHVSLDGHTKELQENLRGDKTYQRTLDGLKCLTDAKIYTRIGTVIYRDNDTKLKEIIEFSYNRGADEIAISIMEPSGRIAGDDTLKTKRSLEDMCSEIELLKEEFEGRIKVHYNFKTEVDGNCINNFKNNNNNTLCPGGDKFIYIDNFGRVAPCTWVVENDPSYYSMSTLKTKSLKEILLSKRLRIFSQNKESCKGSCPVEEGKIKC
jgi:MoaA/NifB/PqqE/SkfB family radical SAM enzyme